MHNIFAIFILTFFASCNPFGKNPLSSHSLGGAGNTNGITIPANFHPGLIPPSITTISPNQGPLVGGTNVTINGSGFKPGAIVKMGDTACVSTTFFSTSRLICMTPAHSISVVDVTVLNTDMLSFTIVDGFSFTSNVSGVPGFGIVSGAAVRMQGTNISLDGSIGETGNQTGTADPVLRGSSVELRTGVQGVMWEP